MLGLLGVHADRGGGLADRLHGTRACDAAARTGHAFQQVAVVLAGLGGGKQVAAFTQALCVGDFDLTLRVLLLDDVDDRLRHSAGDGEVATVGRSVVDAVRVLRHHGQLNVLGVKDTGHFLKGEHEIHFAANVGAHGLELFRRARPDEYDLGVFVLVLDQARGQRHGRERHGDAVGIIGVQLFRHGRPRGTAGGRHERQLFRHLFQEVVGLLRGAQVRADRNLENVRKAELLHRGAQAAGRDLGAELADERGRDGGVNALARLDRADDLEDLGLIRDRAKRAVDQAHAAGNTLVVIDIRLAVLVGADGVHAAGGGAGALLMDDRVVGADLHAAAALDALFLVDHRTPVIAGERNGALGADLDTRMR